MDDQEIISLFWARSEAAISAAEEKYGKHCYSIAYRILGDHEDAMECVNDTYLRAWNSMPPERPESLAAFLGRITRNLSLNRFKQKHAKKRGESETDLALEELEQCMSFASGQDPAEALELQALTDAINDFLSHQSERNRNIFVQRYWLLRPIREIAEFYGISESVIKITLFRMRKRLAILLQEEGFTL